MWRALSVSSYHVLHVAVLAEVVETRQHRRQRIEPDISCAWSAFTPLVSLSQMILYDAASVYGYTGTLRQVILRGGASVHWNASTL